MRFPEVRGTRNPPDFHTPLFPSRRSMVMGRGAMVAASQPLAAQAAIELMNAGGSAADGAVAAAAALTVVEPTGTGLGGDCFCLYYSAARGAFEAVNGSGPAPRRMSRAVLEAAGGMPDRGAMTVTVPGAVATWDALLTRHGRLGLSAALGPAITLAQVGYPVSELIAAAWAKSETLLSGQAEAARQFLPGGRAPHPGEVVRLPELGTSLARIATDGARVMYSGELAGRIAETVQSLGGYLVEEDLAEYFPEWVDPISIEFGPWRVWECPPNCQGVAALIALGIARGCPLGEQWGTPDATHFLIEAMRVGLADARRWVADPSFADLPVERLLTEDYLAERRSAIDPARAALPLPAINGHSDTVYVAVVDADGNGCSLIQSNYMGFGSGLVAGDTGITLQNRGAGFVLEPGHPNDYAPGKRPYHTIMPAGATVEGGGLAAIFGVMGGFMQPQGHLQVVSNILAFGLDAQRALDAPRWQLRPDGSVALEPGFPPLTAAVLAERGHHIVAPNEGGGPGVFGGAQLIAMGPDSIRVGASDPRKDGHAVATL